MTVHVIQQIRVVSHERSEHRLILIASVPISPLLIERAKGREVAQQQGFGAPNSHEKVNSRESSVDNPLSQSPVDSEC